MLWVTLPTEQGQVTIDLHKAEGIEPHGANTQIMFRNWGPVVLAPPECVVKLLGFEPVKLKGESNG